MTKKKSVPHKEDVFKWLFLAMTVRPRSKEWYTYIDLAIFDCFAVAFNKRHFGVKADHRSGHTHKRTKAGVALMREIAKTTNERRPYTLARLVVESGKIDFGDLDTLSAQKTLVRAYRGD